MYHRPLTRTRRIVNVTLDDWMPSVAEGAVLLTVNQRLSRHAMRRFQRWQLANGHTAWETPRILPWQAWIESLHAAMLDTGLSDRVLLPGIVAQREWRRALDDDAGDFIFGRRERGLDRLGLVERQDDGVLRKIRRHARAVGVTERERAAAGLDEQRVTVTMVTAVEFDDFGSTRTSSREAQGTHGCLGSRVDQTNLVNRRHQVADLLRQLDLQFGRRTEAGSLARRYLKCCDDFRVGMPQDHRAP